MPIGASVSLLKGQFRNALSMGKGASIATTSQVFASAIASAASMGIFPTAPTPVPLAPSGLSAGANMIKNALSMGKSASISTTAQMIASAVSMIAPTAPPSGLSGLRSNLKNALSAGKGANINTTATQFASAVVSYYTSGGVI